MSIVASLVKGALNNANLPVTVNRIGLGSTTLRADTQEELIDAFDTILGEMLECNPIE